MFSGEHINLVKSVIRTSNFTLHYLLLSIILQYKTATNVLTAVATIPGPTIAVGFTLPYCDRYGCVKLRLKNCSPICLIIFHYHNSTPALHEKAIHLF